MLHERDTEGASAEGCLASSISYRTHTATDTKGDGSSKRLLRDGCAYTLLYMGNEGIEYPDIKSRKNIA